MPTNKTSFLLAAFILFVCSATVFGATAPEQAISGTLMAEGGNFSCEHCQVTLLANGGRPVATTYTDTAGHCSFQPVPAGSYMIHAEIEGFEDGSQPIDGSEIGGLSPKVLATPAPKGGPRAAANCRTRHL